MKVGFFGKLPSYGDFVQRNVSPKIVSYFDNWILQAIEESKLSLKEDWQHLFFASPIWRFSISAGVIGDNAVSGILMPSVDSAGRCYPFFVLCKIEKSCDIFKLVSNIDACHAKCEEFLLDILEQRRPNLDAIGHTLDTFYADFEKRYIAKETNEEVLSGNELFRFNAQYAEGFSQINENFLSFLMAQHTPQVSIWNRTSSENVMAQYRYFKGMPPALSFESFLKE